MKRNRSLTLALVTMVVGAACTDESATPTQLPGADVPQAVRLPGGLDAEDFEYTIIRHPQGTRTYVDRMNAQGDLLGTYFDGTQWQTFVRRGETYTTQELPAAATALGINERGDLVGTIRTPDGERAFLFRGDAVVVLDAPDNYETRAYDINTQGVIAGSYRFGSGKWQPAIWEEGVFTPLTIITQTLGADMAEGFGINVHGQVVGHFTVADEAPFPGTPNQKMYGFVYHRGQVTATLNYPGSGWMSCAWGKGAHGDAVGHYVDLPTESVLVSGYVWRDDAFRGRLVVPGAIRTFPQSVTPNGVIAGYAQLGGRNERGQWEVSEVVGFTAVPRRPGRR
jgi:hypothetical protein